MWIITLSLLFSVSSFGKTPQEALPDESAILRERLLKIIQSSDVKESEVSIYFSDGGKTGTGIRENELMVPASLSKIPTAAAVLSLLPPGYKAKTRLMGNSQMIKGSQLNGDIYLVGGGDPAFVSESMWFLVNEFHRTGVKTVTGDLIVDDSLFDSVRYPAGRDSQRVDRAYDAPIGAMSFNWNSVSFFVRPGNSVKDKAQVIIDPALALFQLAGQVKTLNSGKVVPQVERLSAEESKEKFLASGAIAVGQPEKVIYKSIRKPDLYAGLAAVEFLRQRGIEVRGTVRTGKAANGRLDVLGEVESKPLPLIVTDMMKWSNNFAAEMLVKLLAVESGEKPATMRTGLEQVRSWLLSRVGLSAQDYRFENAAGLTRGNMFSTKQIVEILKVVQRDFRIYPEFASALPVAGADGTLRSRFSERGTFWVRAKTGLLSGVVGLAGYAGRADGSVMTFAFLFNGRSQKSESARALFDRMAALLADSDVLSSTKGQAR